MQCSKMVFAPKMDTRALSTSSSPEQLSRNHSGHPLHQIMKNVLIENIFPEFDSLTGSRKTETKLVHSAYNHIKMSEPSSPSATAQKAQVSNPTEPVDEQQVHEPRQRVAHLCHQQHNDSEAAIEPAAGERK